MDNGYLITAAHCLDYDDDVGMETALGGHIFYEIETTTGEKMQLAPQVIEAVSDIAVLGGLDGQTFPPDMCKPFESFCERTKPVPLYRKRLEKFTTEIRIHIYTHKKTWIQGKATVFPVNPHQMWIAADENIEGGTSGGPAVNDSGELVGIVSTIGGPDGVTREGRSPVIRHALPIWIYRDICGLKF